MFISAHQELCSYRLIKPRRDEKKVAMQKHQVPCSCPYLLRLDSASRLCEKLCFGLTWVSCRSDVELPPEPIESQSLGAGFEHLGLAWPEQPSLKDHCTQSDQDYFALLDRELPNPKTLDLWT